MSKTSIAGEPGHNSADASASQQLSRQMLERLRERAINYLRTYADSPEELEAAAEKAAADVRVPADKASYAVRLAHCLARHFPDIADMADTRAFVTIETQTGDDARVVGGVLADVLAANGRRVKQNPPTFNLRDEDRYVILAEVDGWQSKAWIETVAEAAARRLPVFGITAKSSELPETLAGADLNLTLPALTAEMLALVFEAAHDAVIQGGRAALLKHFDEIDGKCGDGWITGGTFTAADSYLLIFFRWGKRLEFDMSRYSRWASHVERVLDRPAVVRTIEAEGGQRSDFTVERA